ncbi:MAG: hypothetical protein AAF840_16890, partial [Bacteroidota bacterium]
SDLGESFNCGDEGQTLAGTFRQKRSGTFSSRSALSVWSPLLWMLSLQTTHYITTLPPTTLLPTTCLPGTINFSAP